MIFYILSVFLSNISRQKMVVSPSVSQKKLENWTRGTGADEAQAVIMQICPLLMEPWPLIFVHQPAFLMQ